MASEALIIDQQRYISEGLSNPDMVGKKALKFLDQGFRNRVTFGSLPHYGAGVLAGYAMDAGFTPKLAGLYDENIVERARQAEFVMLSVMDIGLDQAKRVLEMLGPRNNVIAGGYGVTADAANFSEQFPWLTIIPGEAEGVLGQALSDFKEKRQMEQIYRRTYPFDLAKNSLEPHMKPNFQKQLNSLFGFSAIRVTEASRGCNEGCDFCPTAKQKITVKPLPDLFAEIKLMRPERWKPFVFLDQNLMACPPDYLEGLFDHLNDNGIRWAGEGTITYLLDSKELSETQKSRLLQKMGRNCLAFLVGIEDLQGVTRGSATKTEIAHSQRIEEMSSLLRSYKIPMVYSLIFATDNQKMGYAEFAADTVNRLGLTTAAHLATPRLGTNYWTRVEKDGRILSYASEQRNMRYDLVHKPKEMTREKAISEFMIYQALVYSRKRVTERFKRNLLEMGPKYAAGLLAVDATYLGSKHGYIARHSEIAEQVLDDLFKKNKL